MTLCPEALSNNIADKLYAKKLYVIQVCIEYINTIVKNNHNNYKKYNHNNKNYNNKK